MKRALTVFLVLSFGLLFTAGILAQDQPRAAQAAADLRARLAEVEPRHAEQQTRLKQLDEALQPENISRSLAGIGSTRPEELREQRRRQLSIERDGVQKQLDLLATSRARLESAIQVADNRAYQQSAQGFAANGMVSTRIFAIDPRWFLIPFVSIVGLLVSGCMVACIRRP